MVDWEQKINILLITSMTNVQTDPYWFSQILSDSIGEKVIGLSSVDNLIYLSTDYGVTWTISKSIGTDDAISYIAADSSLQYIVAICNKTHLYYSIDFGCTFLINEVGWNAICLLSYVNSNSSNPIFIALANNIIYKSINYGESWTVASSELPTANCESYISFSFDSSNQYLLVYYNEVANFIISKASL